VRADFVNEVARVLDIKRKDLVEKDFILHQILTDLSKDDFFAPNFLFKGGTCLIKCYFGYLRFSEDIDFTWKDQTAFKGMSGKKIRSQLSKTIDRTGEVFEAIAIARRFPKETESTGYLHSLLNMASKVEQDIAGSDRLASSRRMRED
jgi:predicted nucleotidyltransferase component of viral defense system